MIEPISKDTIMVPFSGSGAGTAPLAWGQKAILQDMRDNNDQFTMFGWIELPDGSTEQDAAERLGGLTSRHAALRTRLADGQETSDSGQIGLDVLTLASDAAIRQYVEHLVETWPLAQFDFHRDWPLRMAVVRQEGSCLYLVWVLSHLVADGTANMLLLEDLRGWPSVAGATQHLGDLARSQQAPHQRQLSSRAMRYWESQLSAIPALTFGAPVAYQGHRYWQLRFTSAAAHLAVLAISARTGTDVSRVTLAIVATAIARATGVHPLTVNVMVNNRFRPGLADVFAPIAQNSVVTIDAAASTVDEVVTRTRGATLTSGMRAYYDPDDLAQVIARSQAQRGFPARVSCRFNDQRAMLRRTDAVAGEVTPDQITRALPETTLTWHAPLDHLHDQVSVIILNQTDTLSLYLKCDLSSLTTEQAEALLHGIEEVAVEAAFNQAAETKVPAS